MTLVSKQSHVDFLFFCHLIKADVLIPTLLQYVAMIEILSKCGPVRML